MEKLTKKPTSYGSYEPLADPWIEMAHAADIQDHPREPDLRTGIARVAYTAGGVRYTREALISAVDDCLAVRLTATSRRSR